MRHTTFSTLDSFRRCAFIQVPTQLFLGLRIGVVVQGILLLIGGVACTPTPPPQAGSQTVRFAVIGDYGGTAYNGTDPPMASGANHSCASDVQCQSAVASLVKSWNPMPPATEANPFFIVTVGDNNYEVGASLDIDPNIGQYYHDFIFPYGPPLGNFGAGASFNKFYPSLGNHDWVAPNAQPYVDYFSLPDVIAGGPGNKRYYHVAKGQVHLFAVDSDEHEPNGNTGTSLQATWLQGRLADPSNAEPWKLVFFHYPPFSSGYWWDSNLQWPFQAWGATAVLSGHDHLYERLIYPVSTGIPYFVNGLGGNVKFSFTDACLNDPAQCAAGSQVRYNADYGAMLVQASPTCINFQFIDRGGTQRDTYTLYRLSQNPSESPSHNENPSVDYYVRDWTDSPTSGDTGKVPSTHSQFYTTSDVWNRQSNSPGGFNANNQPQNEDPKNGPGSTGDNYAFARIHRNSCGNGPTDTVTARFLYSEFGTGSNFQQAGSASGSQITFAADTVTAANTVQTMPGHLWNLPATSSIHLCLATEISTPSDPTGPTLLGHAPGWPTTDTMVLMDNNKAQRNMGVYHTMMKSLGKWSFFAIVHNAATYKRAMVLRYEAPPDVLKAKVQLEVINPKKVTVRREGGLENHESAPKVLKSGDRIVFEDMQPGENRWIDVTFGSVEGKEGESLPVSFFELVNNKAVNGFTIAAVPAPWNIVSREILKFHASVFARLAALFGFAKAKEASVEASRVLQMEKITEEDYVTMLKKQINSLNDIIAELLTSQRSEDIFGIRVELKNVSIALQEGAIAYALPAHSTLLHRLDAFLTMLQKSKGDPADILQNVLWQTQLFRSLPQQKALECSTRPQFSGRDKTHREGGDVEAESKEFIRGYETRTISNANYPSLISDLLPCFKETAKEFGGVVQLDDDIANMAHSLDSPIALQKAHHDYLLKLQNAVNKP